MQPGTRYSRVFFDVCARIIGLDRDASRRFARSTLPLQQVRLENRSVRGSVLCDRTASLARRLLVAVQHEIIEGLLRKKDDDLSISQDKKCEFLMRIERHIPGKRRVGRRRSSSQRFKSPARIETPETRKQRDSESAVCRLDLLLQSTQSCYCLQRLKRRLALPPPPPPPSPPRTSAAYARAASAARKRTHTHLH
ncbi:unnamed protein product [Trichogramma brassicae]|uniref:Uncharacterized protein n=1 Tax=Trichogramma brassicae TaxID=86971 RepID=A0A6H5I8B0_9HYME|nr:unnamed protein product [Trichogramma brassicae]